MKHLISVIKDLLISLVSQFQVEIKSLLDENNVLKREMEIEKEKLHTLEAAFERIRKQGWTIFLQCKNSTLSYIKLIISDSLSRLCFQAHHWSN